MFTNFRIFAELVHAKIGNRLAVITKRDRFVQMRADPPFLILLLAFSNIPSVRGSFADWTPHAGRCIQTIIDEGAGKGNLALFDFDNTILCRDIGDATFAVLVRDGLITPESIRKLGFSDFILDGQHVRPEDGVLSYSEHLLRATSGDNSSSSDVGYAWQIQLLSGLSVSDIVNATRTAFRNGIGARDVGRLTVTTIFTPEGVGMAKPFAD
jgi:hypothetical protein